jgi:thiamine biosynthesis protein ThiS
MQVFINNKEKTISEDATIVELLEAEKLHNLRGIAIAIDDMVVPKVAWGVEKLQPGSRILIIKAAQGG